MQAALPWLDVLAVVLQQQGNAACPVLGQDPKLKESMSEALRCGVIFTSDLIAACNHPFISLIVCMPFSSRCLHSATPCL